MRKTVSLVVQEVPGMFVVPGTPVLKTASFENQLGPSSGLQGHVAMASVSVMAGEDVPRVFAYTASIPD